MDGIGRIDYAALFRRQILHALAASLDETEAIGAPETDEAEIIGRGLEIIRFGMRLAEGWSQIRSLLLRLSPVLDRTGRNEEWCPFLEAGIRRAEEEGDPPAHAELQLALGTAHRNLGNYAAARQCLDAAADAFAALGDEFHLGCALNRLAWTERLAGNGDLAMRLTQRARTVLERPHAESQSEKARCFAILGAVAYDMGHFADAEAHYRTVLTIPELALDQTRLAWGHADLGLALSGQGKLEEALRCYDAALVVLQALNAPVQRAVMQLNLAGIYLRMDNPIPPLELCGAAQAEFTRVHDIRRLCMVETNMGIAYRQLARYDAAVQVLTAAIDHAEQIGNGYLAANALNQLIPVYLAQGAVTRARDAIAAGEARVAQMDDSPSRDVLRQELEDFRRQAEQIAAAAVVAA